MFDASKVDGLEAVSRSMAEEAGRTLDKFKVLGESSAMKAVVESQRANNEMLQKFAASMPAPQIMPIDIAQPPGVTDGLRSIGEASARKAKREAAVAEATIGNFRATAKLVDAIIKQGVDIETMAKEISEQVIESKRTSRLTRQILGVSVAAVCCSIAAVILAIV